jgi:hypothetical protein
VKNVQEALLPLIALIIALLVIVDEAGYYISHPRSDHSLTVVLLGLGVGLSLVGYRQWRDSVSEARAPKV